jgi:hypothetical protein
MTVSSDVSQSRVHDLVASALESASPASVISALAEARTPGDQPNVITLPTAEGDQLAIRTLSPTSPSTVELVCDGRIVDPAPSGTFILANGKPVVLEKGRLVGGNASATELTEWALFALMPADRERAG